MNATALNARADSMEHRWGERMPVYAAAEVWSAHGANHEAVIANASLSGAFLQTRSDFAPLSEISLRLLPDGDWLEACVVRAEKAGMAVEWLDPGLRPLEAMLAHGQKRPANNGDAEVVRPEASPVAVQKAVEESAVERARSEVDSDEFDVQG